MAFDKNKDKVTWEKTIEVKDYDLKVALHSYDSNVPKLQISRLHAREGEAKKTDPVFCKLGRLTEAELEALIPKLKEALIIIQHRVKDAYREDL